MCYFFLEGDAVEDKKVEPAANIQETKSTHGPISTVAKMGKFRRIFCNAHLLFFIF